MSIKVSAIVPVYNTERFLEKCIRSIMNQTLKEIEIICINDGSTDNSLEILEKLQKEDNRIKIIDKKNEGVSVARNIGIEQAKGEYYLNIDSDDWIEDNFFKTMYEKAKINNLDMVISDIILEKKYSQSLKKDLEISDQTILTGEEYLKIFYLENFNGYTWNKLIRANIYINNNISYNKNISFCEDVEVISKLALNMNKIGKINKAYYHYMLYNFTSITKNKKIKNYTDFKECCNQLKKYFKEKNLSKNILNLLLQREIYTKLDILIDGDFKNEKKLYKEERKKFLYELKCLKLKSFNLKNVNKITKTCLLILINISDNRIIIDIFKKIKKLRNKTKFFNIG